MKKALFFATLIGILLLAASAVYAKSAGVLDQIMISPNPMDKFTVITLTFNQASNIGVNIETDMGVVVKTLYWGPADEQIVLTWDRIGDDGTTTPSGSYLLVVNFEGRYTSTKKTVILK